MELALELDQPLHRLQRDLVLGAVEGGEHARVIIGRGDGGAETAADRLTDGATADVVVAACSLGLGDDLQLAGVRLQFEHRLPSQVPLEDKSFAVLPVRVQFVECLAEPAEILFSQRGNDVEPVCELV